MSATFTRRKVAAACSLQTTLFSIKLRSEWNLGVCQGVYCSVNPAGAPFMDSVQHCLDQAAECRRLMKSARSEAEAKALKEIALSWTRLAGQIDRYHALMREQV